MPAPEILVVPAQARGQRLDRWLAALPEAATRSQIARAIEAGRITIGGKTAKASHKLRGGERVRIEHEPVQAATHVKPEAIALNT